MSGLIKKKKSTKEKIADAKRRYAAKKTKKTGLNKVEKKQVKKIVQRNGEIIWCPAYHYDGGLATSSPPQYNTYDIVPVPLINTGPSATASAYITGFETGMTLGVEATAVNTALPPAAGTIQCMNPLGMYNFPSTNNTATADQDPGTVRSGEYLYAHSQRVRMRICMKQAKVADTDNFPKNAPMEFRFIAVKRKPGGVIAGDAGVDFRTELFRNFDNNVTGLLNTKSNFMLAEWTINRLALEVVKDFKFRLSQPLSAQSGYAPFATANPVTACNTYNSFPSEKIIDFYLPKPKSKIKWNGSANSDPRDSYNYKLDIFIIGYYTDSGDAPVSEPSEWEVKCITESKFREP